MCILRILLFSKVTGRGIFLVLPPVVNAGDPMTTMEYDRRGWMPDEYRRV